MDLFLYFECLFRAYIWVKTGRIPSLLLFIFLPLVMARLHQRAIVDLRAILGDFSEKNKVER